MSGNKKKIPTSTKDLPSSKTNTARGYAVSNRSCFDCVIT